MYTKSFVATKGCFKVNHWSFMWKQRRMVSFSVALYNIWIRELLGNVSKNNTQKIYEKRFYVHMISFRFLYQTQSNHDLLSRGYSNLRVHHILLVMSHEPCLKPWLDGCWKNVVVSDVTLLLFHHWYTSRERLTIYPIVIVNLNVC